MAVLSRSVLLTHKWLFQCDMQLCAKRSHNGVFLYTKSRTQSCMGKSTLPCVLTFIIWLNHNLNNIIIFIKNKNSKKQERQKSKKV